MSQNVLITGASGFLGSHLTKACLHAGFEVLAYKRQTTDLWRLQDVVDQISWFDIEKGIDKPFRDNHINYVIHTATCYGRKHEKNSEIAATNLFFPLQLLDLATSFKVKAFFNTDTTLDKHINAYSLSKKQFCEWLKQLVNKIKVINIKLEHFYGPQDDTSKFVSYVIEQCFNDVAELKLTSGEQQRDFIYIDDVVNAYLCLLENCENLADNYNEFEVGSGEVIKIKNLVTLIAKITNSKTKLLFGALPYRKNESMLSVAGIEAMKKLGWAPTIGLEAGIKKTILSYKR